MRVGVVGINHRQASLRLRELLAKTCQKWFGIGRNILTNEKFVLLSTCNRTEIYFSSESLAETHSSILSIIRKEVSEDFDQRLYSFFGIDCFYHLSRVTAGLDSAIIWETEIQGQVKAAYESTTQAIPLTKDLHYLFQKGLKNGKLIRSRFQSSRGMPDLEHSLLQTARDFFEDIESNRVLFVGASAINLKILAFLKNKGIQNIALCNRTEKRGLFHAKRLNISFLPWDRLHQWQRFDWIIFGTKSPRHLLTSSFMPKIMSPKLIIDLCVPRNVDPCMNKHPLISLSNIDQIHQTLKIRRQKISHLTKKAEDLLCSAVARQVVSFKNKTKSFLLSRNRSSENGQMSHFLRRE